MSITIELSPETEARVRAQATALQLSMDAYLRQLIERDGAETELDRSLREMINRTPEERAALRAATLAASRPARPLPPGKTLEDVVVGKWPGDETDEQIEAMLRELS